MKEETNFKRRQEQIIWALFDCLAEKGHDKITIKMVANRANVSPGIIHYYFKSKDEMIASMTKALLDKYSNILISQLAEAVSIEEKIECIIDYVVDSMIFNKTLNRVNYNILHMSFENEELNIILRNVFKEYREQLAIIFKESGIKQNNIFLGGVLAAVTEGLAIQLLIDEDVFNRKEVREFIAHLINKLLSDI